MKEVLISVKPYWVFLIIAKTMGWGICSEKTLEVRKTCPKDKDWNKIVKIYCTKDKKSFNDIPKKYQPFMKRFLGKVIGEFVCDYIEEYKSVESKIKGYVEYQVTLQKLCEEMYLSICEFCSYGNGKTLYGWHISDLKIYDKPKELSEFKKINRECWYADLGLAKRDCSKCKDENCYISRPPQSWCYVEGAEE